MNVKAKVFKLLINNIYMFNTKKEHRKLIATRNGQFFLTLPKKWVIDNQLLKGDELLLIIKPKKLIILKNGK